jgi:hypothetical protein
MAIHKMPDGFSQKTALHFAGKITPFMDGFRPSVGKGFTVLNPQNIFAPCINH